MNDLNLSLRELRLLHMLLKEQSLTRTAYILETSQPAVSKTLSRLRQHFEDPLFVRVGLRMHPTPKALNLQQPLSELLAASMAMHSLKTPFDPNRSPREFKILTTDVGMVRFLPPLHQKLAAEGQSLRLKAVPLDTREFSTQLESGEADVALGAFSQAAGTTRHQRLYTDTFVSVVRKRHPRSANLHKLDQFLNESHVVVTANRTGHAAHLIAQQTLEARISPNNIRLRVPNFMTVALIASRSDTVGTMPLNLATYISDALDLRIFTPPITLPRLDIGQFWHERLHQDPGHRWLRSIVFELFGGRRRTR